MILGRTRCALDGDRVGARGVAARRVHMGRARLDPDGIPAAEARLGRRDVGDPFVVLLIAALLLACHRAPSSQQTLSGRPPRGGPRPCPRSGSDRPAETQRSRDRCRSDPGQRAHGASSRPHGRGHRRRATERRSPRAARGGSAGFAVWGEGALDPGATSDPSTSQLVLRTIADVGVPTLAGAVTNGVDGKQRTEALLFDGSGSIVDRYDESASRAVRRIRTVARRARRGSRRSGRSRSTGRRGSGCTPCPSQGSPRSARRSASRTASRRSMRELRPRRSRVPGGADEQRLVRDTAASAQHLQMSRMRAVEDGRWVVHAAVSGISAFIDPSGRSWPSGACSARYPAAHDPVLRRANAVRPAGGLVPVARLLVIVAGMVARAAKRAGAPRRARRRCPGPSPDARGPADVRRARHDRVGARRLLGLPERVGRPRGRRLLAGRHGRPRARGAERRAADPPAGAPREVRARERVPRWLPGRLSTRATT